MTFTDMSMRYRSIGKPKKCTFIFCADHGVAKMNVSAYPQKTTADMVKNYLVDRGGAANVFAKFANSELVVVDVGVNAEISRLPDIVDRKIAYGTKNIAEGPAMTKLQAKKSVRIGKELAEKAIKAGVNCFLIGEMGIANTTVASAITAAILEVPVRKVTGRGSNISYKTFRRKLKIVQQALTVNSPDPADAYDVLSKVGGFEFGAMAGVILAAAKHKCIVMLDGFNTTAAALIASLINPNVSECLIASHYGREIGQRAALSYLEMPPMFELDLALGEAIGSSIASRILDRIVYTFVCDPEDDYKGDVDALSEYRLDAEQRLLQFLEDELSPTYMDYNKVPPTEDSPDDYSEDYLGDYPEEYFSDPRVEEVEFDFQVSADDRLESFEPPFSVTDFNIPRSFPMFVRSMRRREEEKVKATDHMFDFYLKTMPKLHLKAMDKCQEHFNELTKPRRSLGYLEDIAVQIAGITNTELPTNNLRHAALAFTNYDNTSSDAQKVFGPSKKNVRRDVAMDFSMTARTFAMKTFMGIVDQKDDPSVAFNFGRNLAEEISFENPILALTELSDWDLDKLDEKFAKILLKKNGELKLPPETFLNALPKKFRCLASAIIGAIIAAAHNSTLIVVDCGAVEIIARYLEAMCPEIRPFLLYGTKLVNFHFSPGHRIGFDGEVACMGVEIAEAALHALNGMKTFKQAKVEGSLEQ